MSECSPGISHRKVAVPVGFIRSSRSELRVWQGFQEGSQVGTRGNLAIVGSAGSWHNHLALA